MMHKVTGLNVAVSDSTRKLSPSALVTWLISNFLNQERIKSVKEGEGVCVCVGGGGGGGEEGCSLWPFQNFPI